MNLQDHVQSQKLLRESMRLVLSMAPNESRCRQPKPTARRKALRLQVRVSSQRIRIILIAFLESIEKEQTTTPSTQRHKNIFAQFAKPTTPASTPKSRVHATAKLPSTLRTPGTPRSSSNVYNQARQLFARSTTTSQLIGRERERSKLDEFLQEGLASKSGRCLYISGPPGTGKSAFVGEVCNRFSNRDDAQVTYVSCMSINSAREIYERLAIEVCGEVPAGSGAAATALRAKFFPGKDSKVHIVTLDEIDHLLTLDLSCLYKIFEWALNPDSRLVLIGIANALDFTDRFLPRLKARSLKPQLLPFAPYTVSEIDSVITTKLRSLLPSDSAPKADLPFLRPEAIKLLARKVTAQTGDLRKAFDIVRGTIDLIEAKARADALGSSVQAPPTPPSSSPLSENANLASPLKPNTHTPPQTPSKDKDAKDPLAHLTITSAPRATIAHVARVASTVFGSNATSSRLKGLTLQQKASLCALLSLEKKTTAKLKELALGTPSKSTFSKATGVEVRRIWECYVELVKREGSLLAVLSRTEVGEVVDGLIEGGLVREAGKGMGMVGMGRGVGGGGKGRVNMMGMGGVERRVESAVTEMEVRAALQGVEGEMVRGLLDD